MKKNIFLSLVFSIFILSGVEAQTVQSAKITSAVENGNFMELTVSSDKQFYTGGSMYVLHIGELDFTQYKQSDSEGKGKIVFYIPLDEFGLLVPDTNVWMSYGEKYREASKTTDIATLCKENPSTCWSLGKFRKMPAK